ncbi:hypothetical protein CEF21_16665 [Bacillus sp. FJAT-42376]|uniref:hypothetical protein n=1 Tax=Bacillus sp. FJAT-42376 TaxID=2014076 RepID=UPI000F5115A4|nr:hypothetical protein [Bacillus sp. FJAT-42376]AZB43807.1 hypothetical protein CEF21_16665 [Bacillus sp. FJAT-42376]
MLAEINLLPERKRKNYASLMVMGLLALTAILLLLFMQNQFNSEEAEVQRLKQEDLNLQEQLAVTAETDGAENGSAFTTLANAVTWTEDYPVEFVPIMEDLKLKLPNSGYFQSLGYTEANKLTLSIHLEESREAAFYLNRLKEIPYFQTVKLTEMSTQEQVSLANADEEASASLKTQKPYLATFELELNRAKWKEIQSKGEKKDDSVQ